MLVVLPLVGCNQKPPTPATPATDIAYDESDPLSVVRGTLDAMSQEISAIAAKKRDEAARYRALLDEKLSSPAAMQLVNGNKVAINDMTKKAHRLVSQRWEALVAYYIDHIEPDRIRELRRTVTDDSEVVAFVVPAKRDGDEALIRVDLAKTSDGTWQVGSVEFLPPTKAPSAPLDQPTAIPTTQPAADEPAEP